MKDVMRFNEPMYKVEAEQRLYVLPSAGTVAKAFWPHDVHVTKVACASCHSRIHSKIRCRR
ncbi:MAG: hypothetical protein ACLRP3_11455 [Escherichia sp.]